MRLNSVHISGFKSFRDRAVLNFDHAGVSMVVGPNGCGKSNVVDAIRWGLGEHNPRQLRGQSMEEIIFHGSDNVAPQNRCAVSLIFGNDNPQQLAPAYRNQSEIMITRRLYRDGTSEYLINKAICRLSDIRELMLDGGGGGRSYSIVEQGKIDHFLLASPQERYQYLEDAAGISSYKLRRQQSQQHLKRSQQNIVRCNDLLAELKHQADSLAEQKEQAQIYIDAKERLENMQIRLQQLVIEGLEQKVAELDAELHSSTEKRHQLDSGANEQNLLKVETENKLNQCTQELEATAQRIRELDEGLRSKRDQLRLLEVRGDNEQSWLEKVHGEIAQYEQQQSNYSEELAEAEQNKATNDEIALNESSLAQLEDFEQKYKQRQAIAESAQQELNRLQNKLSLLRQEQSLLSKNQTATAERLQTEQSAIAGREQLIATMEQELNLPMPEEDLEALSTAVSEKNKQYKELKSIVYDLDQQQRQLEKSLYQLKMRQSALEDIAQRQTLHGQQGQALLSWFKEHPEQIETTQFLGLFGDLVRIDPHIPDPLRAYVATMLEYGVFKTYAGLEHLFSQYQNRSLVCLVLEAFSEAIQPSALSEWVSFKEPLGEQGHLFFGGVRLRQSDEQRGAIIAPDGQYFSTADGRVYLLGKSEKVDDAVELEQLAKNILHSTRELEQATIKLSEQRTLRRSAEDEYRQLSQQLMLKQSEQQRQNSQFKLQQQSIAREKNELQQKLNSISKLEQDRESFTATSTKISAEIEELEHQVLANQNDAEKMSIELQEQKIAYEAIVDKKIEAQLKAKLLDKQQSKSKFMRAEYSRIEQELNAAKSSLAAHQVRQSQFVAEAKKLTEELEQDNLQRNVIEQSYRQAQQTQLELKGELQRIQANLNTTYASLKSTEQHQQQLEIRISAERARLGELEPPQAELDSKYAELNNINELQRCIAKDKNTINGLAEVNLQAPAQWASLQQRIDTTEAEKNDIEQAISDLESSVEYMNAESRRRFNTAFKAVSENFTTMFEDVFPGGAAAIELEKPATETNGLSFKISLPGKRIQNLNLLSGGEKSLVALIFLCALFNYKPGPFFILDEADAALDNANVSRFLGLIQKMTAVTKFIIITHNHLTMRIGEALYGVTMQEDGRSEIVTLDVPDEFGTSSARQVHS